MSILTTAIGLVLVYLILSLIATAAQEAVASWFSLRSNTLGYALERMLTNESTDEKVKELDKSVLEKFCSHARYQNMRPEKGWYHNLLMGSTKHPSYMSASTFASILLHVLDGSDIQDLKKTIDDMNDGKLKNYLLDLLNEAGTDLTKFRESLEKWYNDMMDRATGWYKRNVHNILLVLGLLLCLFFNADTVTIYQKMSSVQTGSAEEQQLFALAQSYVDEKYETYDQQLVRYQTIIDSLQKQPDSLRNVDLLLAQGKVIRGQTDSLAIDLVGATSPLGLGWTQAEWQELKQGGIKSWLVKIVGLIITTLAISLGAPFWFDILKQVINIRNAGTLNVSGQGDTKRGVS